MNALTNPPKTSIRQYSEDEAVFVFNRSNKPNGNGVPTQEFGDITLTVKNAEGDEELVTIYKTTNPIELTAYATLTSLKNSVRLNDFVNKKMIEFVDEDEARRILSTSAGQSEANRLARWQSKSDGEGSKFTGGSPRSPGVNTGGGMVTGDGGTLDIILTLIDNIQSGKIELVEGAVVMKNLFSIYNVTELTTLASNVGITSDEIASMIQSEIRQRRTV